jgi:hypothetical protein
MVPVIGPEVDLRVEEAPETLAVPDTSSSRSSWIPGILRHKSVDSRRSSAVESNNGGLRVCYHHLDHLGISTDTKLFHLKPGSATTTRSPSPAPPSYFSEQTPGVASQDSFLELKAQVEEMKVAMDAIMADNVAVKADNVAVKAQNLEIRSELARLKAEDKVKAERPAIERASSSKTNGQEAPLRTKAYNAPRFLLLEKNRFSKHRWDKEEKKEEKEPKPAKGKGKEKKAPVQMYRGQVVEQRPQTEERQAAPKSRSKIASMSRCGGCNEPWKNCSCLPHTPLSCKGSCCKG